MREIKFREFYKKENIMYRDIDISNECLPIHDNNVVIMQYTGLKDKNGVEIYEGDLIKTKNSLYKVIYDKCCFWGIDEMGKYPIYQIKHYVMEDEIFEVIGNIHENPEMLELE